MPACAAPGAEGTATAEATTPVPVPTQETPASPPGDDNLANTEWTLESFGPMGAETPVLEGTTVTLIFESGGQAGGSGGCNSYGTDYQVQDNTLIFGEIVSTLMACTEEGVTEQEQRYLTALRSAGEFEQTADQLIIHYDNGQGVLNFNATSSVVETPTPSEDEGNSLVGTQWQLESFGPTAAEMPVVEGSTITLEFETAEQAVGSGGCNSYGGDYTVQGDTISFGQIVSTEIACLDQAVTEQEQRYFEALHKIIISTPSRLGLKHPTH
jgi:heat shock protein HslJ